MSPSHGYLLMHVVDDPGIQPGQLSQHLQLQPSTVTRLIEKLEAKKLLVRTTEGKITNVFPTPRAKELYVKMQACIARFSSAHHALLGKEEGKKMVQQLNRLADRFTE